MFPNVSAKLWRNSRPTCQAAETRGRLTVLAGRLAAPPPRGRDVDIPRGDKTGEIDGHRPAQAPARALRGVFARLGANATAATNGLTRALGVSGWQQQDAQEYLRLLVGALLDAEAGPALKACYEGRLENYLEATDDEAERLGRRPSRTRPEPFYDVSLDVAGRADVGAALQAYLEPELMAGENRWKSDDGPCDALRGVRFDALPPVLVLHLKRFEYDYNYDEVRKLGDRVDVPFALGRAAFEPAPPAEETIADPDGEPAEAVAPAAAEDSVEVDADGEPAAEAVAPAEAVGAPAEPAAPAAAPPAEDDDPYVLHAVVVHVGGGTGGHYYAYVDPNLDGRWVKFDDDRVSSVDAAIVRAEASGGHLGGGASVGAYLLQYVRKSDAGSLGLAG